MSFCITIPALKFGSSQLNESHNKSRNSKEISSKPRRDNPKNSASKPRSEVRVKTEPVNKVKVTSSRNKENLATSQSKSKNALIKKALPFKLPLLSKEQRQILKSGRAIEEISSTKRKLSSDCSKRSDFVVVDIDAPASVIWQYLLDFESYPLFISKVKDAKILNRTRENKHRIAFQTEFLITSRRIKAHITHKYTKCADGDDYMSFSLDSSSGKSKSSSKLPGIVQAAKGIWYTHQITPYKTRTWMICNIQGFSFLPKWMLQNATQRFMPMAAKWVKPNAEMRYNSLQLTNENRDDNNDEEKYYHLKDNERCTKTTTNNSIEITSNDLRPYRCNKRITIINQSIILERRY